MHAGRGTARTRFAIAGMILMAGALVAGAARADWLSDHLDVHGYFESKVYTRTPDFLFEDAAISSLRSELNVETGLRLYDEGDLRFGLQGPYRRIAFRRLAAVAQSQ